MRAVLDTSAPAAFEALLDALMGIDNSARGAAEALFEACKAQAAEALVAQLVRCLRTSARTELRSLAAVLLRKVRRRARARRGGASRRRRQKRRRPARQLPGRSRAPAPRRRRQVLTKGETSPWAALSAPTQARARAARACAARPNKRGG